MATPARKIRFMWSAAAVLMLPGTVLALQPPRPGEMEKYARDGSRSRRLAKSAELGNHQTDPRLVWNLQQRLLKIQGKRNPQMRQAAVNAPPPSWQGGLPASGTPKTFVLLIDFPDYPHDVINPQALVQEKFFGNGNPPRGPL